MQMIVLHVFANTLFSISCKYAFRLGNMFKKNARARKRTNNQTLVIFHLSFIFIFPLPQSDLFIGLPRGNVIKIQIYNKFHS